MLQHSKRLGRLVVARRLELGIRTAKDLADRLDISARSVSDIENGKRAKYQAATLSALDRVLQWAPGSAAAVLEGGALSTSAGAEVEDVPVDLIAALDLEPSRFEGLSSADIAEVEMAARLAASEKAGALQARNRVVIASKSMEAVQHRVDTRTTDSKTPDRAYWN